MGVRRCCLCSFAGVYGGVCLCLLPSPSRPAASYSWLCCSSFPRGRRSAPVPGQARGGGGYVRGRVGRALPRLWREAGGVCCHSAVKQKAAISKCEAVKLKNKKTPSEIVSIRSFIGACLKCLMLVLSRDTKIFLIVCFAVSFFCRLFLSWNG